jgi:hypothetical protein
MPVHNESYSSKFRGLRFELIKIAFILLLCLSCFVRQGYSQENTGQGPAKAQNTKAHSEEDLLKATQNPVADLISIPIQNIANFKIGPYSRTDNAVSFQPVIPLTLSNDWMLVSRIIQLSHGSLTRSGNLAGSLAWET